MNDNMTARLLTKLIELKSEFDTTDKKLTFKVTASNRLMVRTYPYMSGVIFDVDLNSLAEETYNHVVNAIRADFAR